jgi:hypothetical protein
MMATTSFLLDVSHAQVAVFDSGLEQPFNSWTERHVKQGFSWRPGSVSFATIKEAGQHLVIIDFASGYVDNLSSDATRIIEVPFEVPQSGAMEVASISSSTPVSLPSGSYALRFEYFNMADAAEPTIRFLFMQTETPSFKIWRGDADLMAVADHLLLSAAPA